MNTRKAYTNVIKVVMGIIMFFSLMSMACDETPCASLIDASCTTSVERTVGDMLAGDNPQNVLSGGNP